MPSISKKKLVVEFSGETQEDLDSKGVSHFHPYEARAVMMADGTIGIEFSLGKPNRGESHSHQRFQGTIDDPEAMSFSFQTSDSSEEKKHSHTVEEELDEPIFGAKESEDEDDDEPDDGSESEGDSEEEDDPKEDSGSESEDNSGASSNVIELKKPNAPAGLQILIRQCADVRRFANCPQITPGQMVYEDGGGFLDYRKEHLHKQIDKRADHSFRAPVFEQGFRFDPSVGLTEEQIKTILTDDGLLPQELYRTGTFRHWLYGEVKGTHETLEEMEQNFLDGVMPQKVILNLSHQHDRGSQGELIRTEIRPKKYGIVNSSGVRELYEGYSLWGYTQLMPGGYREFIVDMRWPYISSEISRKYRRSEVLPGDDDGDGSRDDELDMILGPVTHYNVLVGYAGCCDPFIPNLQPMVASQNKYVAARARIVQEGGGDVERAFDALRKVVSMRNKGVQF